MKKIGSHIVLAFIVLLAISCSENDEFGCQLSLNLNVDQTQLTEDIRVIDSFLLANAITPQIDPSGLRYVVENPGVDDNFDIGLCDEVAVTYVGTLLSDGSQFDAAASPIPFVLGGLIVGWQIGIPLVEPGGSITLYIPSVYGYGSSGLGTSIGPDENLVFKIDLVSVN